MTDRCPWCRQPLENDDDLFCENCNSTWARCSKCGDTGMCSDDRYSIFPCPFCDKGREQAELEQLTEVKGY